jgi:hypothetical protein
MLQQTEGVSAITDDNLGDEYIPSLGGLFRAFLSGISSS